MSAIARDSSDPYPFIPVRVVKGMEPCPFCGCTALRFWNGNVGQQGEEPSWCVTCNYCTADGPPAATQADAIAVWNERHV